jgi:NAD(P)-dependent dehydrogenase (short-subunit alcohol dehydrogenase family)
VRYGSLVRRPLGFHLVEQLEGHVALVTGGNGGIGLGLAQGLVKAGADVAIWGTNVDKSADAVRHLESLRGSGSILALRCDITDEAQVVGAFADTVEHFGKVDSVFANAGIPGASPRFVDLSLDEWRRVMAVNLDGTFLTLREGARHLVARDQGGALIALSSIAALQAGGAVPGPQPGHQPRHVAHPGERVVPRVDKHRTPRLRSRIAKVHRPHGGADPRRSMGDTRRVRESRGVPGGPVPHIPHRSLIGRRRGLYDLLIASF